MSDKLNRLIKEMDTVQYKFTPSPDGRGCKFNDGFAVENQLSPHLLWLRRRRRRSTKGA